MSCHFRRSGGSCQRGDGAAFTMAILPAAACAPKGNQENHICGTARKAVGYRSPQRLSEKIESL